MHNTKGAIMFPESLLEIGTAGVVVLVVLLFLRAAREERRAFLTTINNHLNHLTKAMEDHTKVLHDFKTLLSEIKGVIGRGG